MDRILMEGLESACRQAGALLLRFRSTGLRVGEKGGAELVTDADTASEELLETMLAGLSPGVPFVGEEGYGGALPQPPYWIADPLDGTNNFAFDFPFYSVSVAFVDGSGPAFGCTFDPVRNEAFTAERGGGARLNGVPLRCSSSRKLSDVLVATGFPYHRTPDGIDRDLKVLAHFLGRVRGIRRSGSAALDLAYTACGRLGAFWERSLRPWDMAAGVLLVNEAGGVVGAYEGGGWHPGARGVCASGPGLWNALREGIERGGTEGSAPVLA